MLVLYTLIDPIVFAFDFTTDESGILGMIAVSGNIVGMFIYGVFLKYFKLYKTSFMLVGVTTIMAMGFLYIALWMQNWTVL